MTSSWGDGALEMRVLAGLAVIAVNHCACVMHCSRRRGMAWRGKGALLLRCTLRLFRFILGMFDDDVCVMPLTDRRVRFQS